MCDCKDNNNFMFMLNECVTTPKTTTTMIIVTIQLSDMYYVISKGVGVRF